MREFQRILMATDFSEASLPAWKKALAMAKGGGTLFIFHAYEPPNVAQAEAIGSSVYQEWDQNLRAGINEKLDLMVNEARRAGINATRMLEAGNAEELIVRVADDYETDLIIMGTHGRKGFSRIFLGSVAARVIAMAPCAVLTVRLTEEKTSEKRLASA